MQKINLFLALFGILFMCGCSSSTISNSRVKLKIDREKIKLIGTLPDQIQSGKKFHSIINVNGAFIKSASLNDAQIWINIDVSESGKKVILFGRSPKDEGMYWISIDLTYNSGRKMGFSFSLVVMKKKQIPFSDRNTTNSNMDNVRGDL